MRCEDVHAELTRDAVAPDRCDAVASHLATCARCRHLRALLEHMDVTLRGGPVWTPPEGFAQRNALRGSRLVVQASTRPRERIVPRALRAAALGVLVAAATHLGADALNMLAPVTGEFIFEPHGDRPRRLRARLRRRCYGRRGERRTPGLGLRGPFGVGRDARHARPAPMNTGLSLSGAPTRLRPRLKSGMGRAVRTQ